LPPTSGGPYARPDVDDNGNAVTNTRRYQAAVVQSDVVLNKEGWHYPQQRWLSLWQDVKPVLDGKRPPQPLFFRANSGESIEFWHTNLVPSYYEMDDYQVRTPTDIIGQHIHLVKFDVLASDGAANGFNYEDGTFAPDEVRDRIKQINKGFPTSAGGGLYTGRKDASGGYPGIDACLNSGQPLTPCLRALTRTQLTAQPANPVFGNDEKYLGAQTTIQLWDSDPLMNSRGKDRTLRTVFTHDHFGPSTHQNVGLYAGLLIEPQGSSWFDPLTGAPMGGRGDGGPTSWAANIITANPAESYREFALEFQDLQEAYTATSITKPQAPTKVPLFTLGGDNLPPGDKYATYILELQKGVMPAGLVDNFQSNGITLSRNPNRTQVMPSAKCPTEAKYTWCIQDPQYLETTFGIQLSNAPDSTPVFSVFTPSMTGSWADPAHAIASNSTAPDISPTLINANPATGVYSLNYRSEPVPLRLQGGGDRSGDPAWAFASLTRNNTKLNVQPEGGTPVAPKSPFLYPPPLLPKTLLNGTDPFTPVLSAYENDRVQIRTLVGAHTMTHSFRMNGLNWLYEPDYPNSGYKSAQGMGLSEHFEPQFTVPSVVKVPPATSSDYFYAASSSMTGLAQGLWGMLRAYDGSKGILPDLKPLPNNRLGHAPTPVGTGCPAGAPVRKYTVVAASPQQLGLTGGLVYNTRGFAVPAAKQAAVYVNADDLQGGKLKPNIKNIEPLILRANAGDCIQVTLGNSLSAPPGARPLPSAFSGITPTASLEAGLQADLLSFNVRLGAGMNIGANQAGPTGVRGTVPPGGQKLYEWYAGKISPTGTGIPIEFGAIPLNPADPLNQAADGMIGTLVIEPAGSTWALDPGTRASATITPRNGPPFREFVVMLQNALVPFSGQTTQFQNTSSYNVTSGINYRSEPMGLRQPLGGGAFVITTGDFTQFTKALNECGTNTFECLSKSALAPVFKSANSSTGQGFTLIPSATSTPTSSNQWKITNGNYSINVSLNAGPTLAVSYAISPTTNAVLLDYSTYLSNTRVGGANSQPQTPTFCAAAGQPVRFRVTQPGGDFDHMMVIDGHSWKQEPYTNNSSRIGNNVLSQQMGTQVVSPNEKLDLVIDSAGGAFKVPGDYLYHSFQFQMFGMWGLFRVLPENTPANKVTSCAAL
jgi:manganese oxidase